MQSIAALRQPVHGLSLDEEPVNQPLPTPPKDIRAAIESGLDEIRSLTLLGSTQDVWASCYKALSQLEAIQLMCGDNEDIVDLREEIQSLREKLSWKEKEMLDEMLFSVSSITSYASFEMEELANLVPREMRKRLLDYTVDIMDKGPLHRIIASILGSHFARGVHWDSISTVIQHLTKLADPFYGSQYSEIRHQQYRNRNSKAFLFTINHYVQAKINDIRIREERLWIDTLGDRPIEPLNGLLHELKSISGICVGMQGPIDTLARKIVRRINIAAPYCIHHLSLDEIRQITRRGLPQARKDKMLYEAVRKNADINIIRHLVECGANIRQVGSHGRNLLMLAAIYSEESTIKYLLSLGFNPRERDNQGLTAASIADASRVRVGQRYPLPRNTFFNFDVANENDSFITTFIWAIEMLFLDILCFFLPPLHPDRQFFKDFILASYAVTLAPANTSLCVVREKMPRSNYAAFSAAEGSISLSYLLNIIESDWSGLTALVYIILCYLAYRCLDERTFQKICIDYVAPFAKCLNLVNSVAMVFLSSHPVFATVNLALYTISVLDSYGYLPVPIQKIYYLVLWTVATSVHTIMSCLTCRLCCGR